MRVRSLKSHNTSASVLVRACTVYVCVHAHTCAFVHVHVRVRSCMYVCVRAHTSASVPLRLRSCVCMRLRSYMYVMKGPDLSARIISDASGRVFHSRTFEVYYSSRSSSVTITELPRSILLLDYRATCRYMYSSRSSPVTIASLPALVTVIND